MCARDVTLRSPPPRPLWGRHEARASQLRTSSAFLKMADGLCTGDAVRRNNTIEEKQGVHEKQQQRYREDMECRRANGFLVTSVISDKLCGDDDGLCPKQQQQQHEEGFLVEEMPTEDDCRKKRCVDRYDSSESSDRYVMEFVDTIISEPKTHYDGSSQVEEVRMLEFSLVSPYLSVPRCVLTMYFILFIFLHLQRDVFSKHDLKQRPTILPTSKLCPSWKQNGKCLPIIKLP